MAYTFPAGINDIIQQINNKINSLPGQCDVVKPGSLCEKLFNDYDYWNGQKQALLQERNTEWYYVSGRGLLPDMWVRGLDDRETRLRVVRDALLWERNSKSYCYGGQCATGLTNYWNLLQGMGGALLAERDTQTYCYDGQCRQGLWNFKVMLEGMHAKYSTEQGWLLQINHWQWLIELNENQKQAMKNHWCGNSDPLVADARSSCGLQPTCGVTGPASRYDEGIGPWRSALDPLAGQLACMAGKLAQRAQEKFDEVNSLTRNQLDPQVSQRIQELLAEAEQLEQEARRVCLEAAAGG
jgi:hypothetical protein